MKKKIVISAISLISIIAIVVLIIVILSNSTQKNISEKVTNKQLKGTSKFVLSEDGINNKDSIDGSQQNKQDTGNDANGDTSDNKVEKETSTKPKASATPKPTLKPEDRWNQLVRDNDDKDKNKDKDKDKEYNADVEDSKHIPQEVRDYDLYEDFLFGVTDNETYKEDKTFVQIRENLQLSRDFVNAFFNISYKDIDTDKAYKKRAEKILYFFEPDASWYSNNGKIYSAEKYVDTWLSLIKSTKTTIKARFYTDQNLIYGSPSMIIRGAFQYKVTACKDTSKLNDFTCLLVSKTDDDHKKEKPVKVGTSYYSAVEFTFANTLNGAAEWDVGTSTIQYYSILGQIKEGVI